MLSSKIQKIVLNGLVMGLVLCAPSTHADLVSPEVANAHQRFNNNPKLIDQTDQYCANKSINAACTIAGTVFEGGGKGKCMRELVNSKIALHCQRTESVIIDRKIPEKFSQQPPFPQVSDRFCAKLKVGSACTVTLKHNNRDETFKGVCKQSQKRQGYRFQPDIQIVTSCEPINATPARIYQALNPVNKLFRAW